MPFAVIPAGGLFPSLLVILLYLVLPGLLGVSFLIASFFVESWRLRVACLTGVLLVGLWFAGLLVSVLRPAMGGRPARETAQGVVSCGPWLTFMASEARTGGAAGARGPTAGQLLWTFRDGMLGSALGGSPAVSGNRVLVGADNHRLTCLDADTGAPVWTFTARHPIFASPVVADGRVYLGEGLHETEDAKVYCLDAATGKPQWSFQTTSHVEFAPTLHETRLYVGAGEDGVYCLDAHTGEKVWQYPDAHVDMSPAVTATGVYFGSVYGEQACYALDPATGRLVWKRPAPYGVCGSPSTAGGRVHFGLGNGDFEMSHADPKGSVWCLDAVDGDTVWTHDVGDAVLTSVAIADGSVFFGSRDGHVTCLDAATGNRRWAFDARTPVLSSPAVVDGKVYFGADSGLVRCLEAANGELLWEYDTSQASFSADTRVVASPAIGDGRLYVGSMNGTFFCLGEPVIRDSN